MNPLLKTITNAIGGAAGTKKGLLSILAEKTGKISFKRSASIVAITWVMKNANDIGEINLYHTIIISVALLAPALPDLFVKRKYE